ncbi:MAG: 3'(2'),5'-bisphosphate nucleotidase, partial [Alphaproteobacteria bacterium]|nr:3'(2'),5'-bisphosphate nucleotidase [Alphaproteobacteria bacterium]
TSKLLDHPKALCNQLRRVAIDAGRITLDYFDDAGCVLDDKSDGSPVTLADQKAEDFIRKALHDILPDIPFIGEEARAANACDLIGASEYFWLVDPLDGTKEFISGSGEYTVNIALVYQNFPCIGIVYAPVIGDLYGGFGAGTSFKWHEESNHEKLISVRDMPREGLTVVSSKSHGSGERQDRFLEDFKINKVLK